MKNAMITEFVKIEPLETTTDEQLLEKAEKINDFISKQDGFIDSELVKALDGKSWYFIFHIESMEKVKLTGEKIRSIKLFDILSSLITPGSMSLSFYNQVKRW